MLLPITTPAAPDLQFAVVGQQPLADSWCVDCMCTAGWGESGDGAPTGLVTNIHVTDINSFTNETKLVSASASADHGSQVSRSGHGIIKFVCFGVGYLLIGLPTARPCRGHQGVKVLGC